MMSMSIITVAALFASSEALALSCDEIMNMVNVNVPTNIVVQTLKDSGESFSSSEIRCLLDNGAPYSIVDTAKEMSASAAPSSNKGRGSRDGRDARDSRDSRDRGADRGSRGTSLDADDDVIGGRKSSKRSRGDSSSRELRDDGDSGARDPDKVREAIKLLKSNRPLSASLMLFELLEDNAYPQ